MTEPTLTEFLLACIAEDEADAEAASSRSATWTENGTWYLEGVEHDVVGDEEAFCHPHNVRHIARHDPARVLAECQAKRSIIKRETGWWRKRPGAPAYNGPLNDPLIDPSLPHPQYVEYTETHCEQVTDTATLRDLALVYVDRPGYRKEWRP